jgi:hypothetical protein
VNNCSGNNYASTASKCFRIESGIVIMIDNVQCVHLGLLWEDFYG